MDGVCLDAGIRNQIGNSQALVSLLESLNVFKHGMRMLTHHAPEQRSGIAALMARARADEGATVLDTAIATPTTP